MSGRAGGWRNSLAAVSAVVGCWPGKQGDVGSWPLRQSRRARGPAARRRRGSPSPGANESLPPSAAHAPVPCSSDSRPISCFVPARSSGVKRAPYVEARGGAVRNTPGCRRRSAYSARAGLWRLDFILSLRVSLAIRFQAPRRRAHSLALPPSSSGQAYPPQPVLDARPAVVDLLAADGECLPDSRSSKSLCVLVDDVAKAADCVRREWTAMSARAPR